jgi:hypothetical protein
MTEDVPTPPARDLNDPFERDDVTLEKMAQAMDELTQDLLDEAAGLKPVPTSPSEER